VAAADAVEAIQCATDLEALVLEDHHIRRLSPRFNTVRQQRTPRFWIRLPPEPPPSANKRQPAPRRLELSLGPPSADGEFVGPFRNETLAQQARLLARDVFDLDRLRRAHSEDYAVRLGLAWAFLHGDSGPAEELAGARSASLLRQVVGFDVLRDVLPADPRTARYALVRPDPAGVEGFLLDRGVLRAWTRLDVDDFARFAADLLADSEPRTSPEDADVVLRWLGAQRPPARLVALPDDLAAAVDAIEAAASDLAWEA